jgi:RimJ/RimL family protein N-acetyltransferase
MRRLHPIELVTDHLILREFRKNDWQNVHAYACDPEVVRYMPWGPNTEQETKDFIATTLAFQTEDPRRKFELAVTRASDGQIVGGCGIRIVNVSDRSADMGYVIRRDVWGSGYATEAARAIVAFGFGQLGLHRIWATCDSENAASARVLEKAGMSREAVMREDTWLRGKWRDSYLYAVLEQEWAESESGRSR